MQARILSTKLLDPSLSEKFKSTGLMLEEHAFIKIRTPLTQEKKPEVEAWLNAAGNSPLIFTSANAVRSLHSLLVSFRQTIDTGSWHVYCLSGKTKRAVMEVFPGATIKGVADNALDLSGRIIEDTIESVTFFCGNRRRDDLPKALQRHGIGLREIQVYETIMLSVQLEGAFAGILFFSPSAVQAFFKHHKPGPEVVFFAIGATTAAEIHKFAANKILTGGTPDPAVLLELVGQHFSAQLTEKNETTLEK